MKQFALSNILNLLSDEGNWKEFCVERDSQIIKVDKEKEKKKEKKNESKGLSSSNYFSICNPLKLTHFGFIS